MVGQRRRSVLPPICEVSRVVTGTDAGNGGTGANERPSVANSNCLCHQSKRCGCRSEATKTKRCAVGKNEAMRCRFATGITAPTPPTPPAWASYGVVVGDRVNGVYPGNCEEMRFEECAFRGGFLDSCFYVPNQTFNSKNHHFTHCVFEGARFGIRGLGVSIRAYGIYFEVCQYCISLESAADGSEFKGVFAEGCTALFTRFPIVGLSGGQHMVSISGGAVQVDCENGRPWWSTLAASAVRWGYEYALRLESIYFQGPDLRYDPNFEIVVDGIGLVQCDGYFFPNDQCLKVAPGAVELRGCQAFHNANGVVTVVTMQDGYVADVTPVRSDAQTWVLEGVENISAAGTTQGAATALTTQINVVTTVSSGQGVRLPSVPVGVPGVVGVAGVIVGITITVVNRGANPLLVYPPTSGVIENLGTNQPATIDIGGTARFILATSTPTSTQWWMT